MPRTKNKKRQMMAIIICLFFLLSTIMGAILANSLSLEDVNNLQSSLETLFQKEQNSKGFSSIFFKYLKYDVLIWLGGCFYYGAILSAGVLAFRGISLGYTASVLFRTYGAKGIFPVICSMLPQNLILLPIYFFMTWIAFCFLLEQKSGQYGKGALKREVTRRWTEYIILFVGSVLAVILASLVEIYVSKWLLSMISGFLL